jgi:hypothetical protein
MNVSFAHLRESSTSGGFIDFAVFGVKSVSGSNSDNGILLSQLTSKARAAGLKVDRSAPAFERNGRVHFYGDQNLVNYLSSSGVPRWTHALDL